MPILTYWNDSALLDSRSSTPGLFVCMKIWKPELTNLGDCQIGEGTIIHPLSSIYDGVIIGKNCKIEAGALLFDGVVLEDNVFIGPGAIFTNDKSLKEDFEISKTLVKKGAKIGAGAMIRAGVTIGENSIVGMGSVVLKDVPPNSTVVGNPAKPIIK